jgi:hypothetical protein
MLSIYELAIKSNQEKQVMKSTIILRLVQQTTECAIFLREYSDLKTLGKLLTLTCDT